MDEAQKREPTIHGLQGKDLLHMKNVKDLMDIMDLHFNVLIFNSSAYEKNVVCFFVGAGLFL